MLSHSVASTILYHAQRISTASGSLHYYLTRHIAGQSTKYEDEELPKVLENWRRLLADAYDGVYGADLPEAIETATIQLAKQLTAE